MGIMRIHRCAVITPAVLKCSYYYYDFWMWLTTKNGGWKYERVMVNTFLEQSPQFGYGDKRSNKV